MSYLELYGHHVKCGREGQDGGVGPEESRQRCPTVPEEQGVPGQEAGAEVRFTHQDWDLEERRFTLIILRYTFLTFCEITKKQNTFGWDVFASNIKNIRWAELHQTCSLATGQQRIEAILTEKHNSDMKYNVI